MVTVRDFIDGVELEYSHKGTACKVTYRTGVGLYVECEGKEELIAGVDDVGARRVYWNLNGGKREKKTA